MARYGEAFRDRVVARLLPPESANVGAVAKEIGVSVQTLERWREHEVYPPELDTWRSNAMSSPPCSPCGKPVANRISGVSRCADRAATSPRKTNSCVALGAP
jgi:hypothetical protein